MFLCELHISTLGPHTHMSSLATKSETNVWHTNRLFYSTCGNVVLCVDQIGIVQHLQHFHFWGCSLVNHFHTSLHIYTLAHPLQWITCTPLGYIAHWRLVQVVIGTTYMYVCILVCVCSALLPGDTCVYSGVLDTSNKGHLSIKDTCFDLMLILLCII